MNEIKIYTELTYLESFDGEVYTTEAPLELVKKLLEEKFIQIGSEVVNTSSIKRAFRKELNDIDKFLIGLDKELRKKVEKELEERRKNGLRINMEIMKNVLNKYLQQNG